MKYIKKHRKDPNAILDYGWDWADPDEGPWLAEGDTIVASEFIADTGITVEMDSFTNTTTTVWLAGGEAGTNYEVTNRITTSGGRIDDRTALIICEER